MLPTENPRGATSGAGEGTGQHNLKCGLNPKTYNSLRTCIRVDESQLFFYIVIKKEKHNGFY